MADVNANVDIPIPTGIVTHDAVNPGRSTPAAVRTLLNVANGATANASDANLRDRATHTGAQPTSSITGLDPALALLAPKADPAFTGTPTAPTAAPGTNTAQLATMAALQAAVAAAVTGFAFKDRVRVKSTANVDIATAIENGDTLNGVVLATGNRVLLADQTAPAENGIYDVQASGAATRSADADSWGELVSAFVVTEEGTVGADTAWLCTVNAGGTLNTTAVTFFLYPTAGGGTAAGTTFSPTGNISTTNVQAAIAEVDAEKQPIDATLTALAALDATAGIVEQTGADTFAKRSFGVGAGTSVPTRADADARYAAAAHAHAQSDVTNLTTDLGLKAPLASPTFTGAPLAPTATAGTSTTQIATTAFATTADNLKAPLASPTFTGTPLAPTAAADTNTTQLATTAYVQGELTDRAPLASPTFTGTPAAPTAAADTNTTQVATTAFVQQELSAANAPGSFSGHIETVEDKTYWIDLKAPSPYTINSLTRDVMTSGSCTIAIQIDGVPVTGLSGLTANTTETETNATAANTVAAGATVAMVVTGNSACIDLAFTLKVTNG